MGPIPRLFLPPRSVWLSGTTTPTECDAPAIIKSSGAETKDAESNPPRDDGLADVLVKLTEDDAREVGRRMSRHRNYLTESVVPQVAAGLLAAAELRPVDPIEFLAEHLIRRVWDAIVVHRLRFLVSNVLKEQKTRMLLL